MFSEFFLESKTAVFVGLETLDFFIKNIKRMSSVPYGAKHCSIQDRIINCCNGYP